MDAPSAISLLSKFIGADRLAFWNEVVLVPVVGGMQAKAKTAHALEILILNCSQGVGSKHNLRTCRDPADSRSPHTSSEVRKIILLNPCGHSQQILHLQTKKEKMKKKKKKKKNHYSYSFLALLQEVQLHEVIPLSHLHFW